jgi:hypothetical protein
VFCSVLSVVLDIVRLLLWQRELLGHSLGLVSSLENFYLILSLFGIALKVRENSVDFLNVCKGDRRDHCCYFAEKTF